MGSPTDIRKKTKIVIGKNGYTVEPNADGSLNVNVISSTTYIVVDEKPADYIDVDELAWKDIIKYFIPMNSEFYLKELLVNLRGFNADFEVSIYDGTQPEYIFRKYNLNTQQSNFCELLGTPFSIDWNAQNPYVIIRCKMNGKNQQGKAFGVINGLI